ncbi:MAG: ABC transporter ATP-binding protein [Acidimicrobiia bacterium]
MTEPVTSEDSSPKAVLELQDVHKEYPGTPPVRALRGVTLRIASGELVGVVGPSGSGKSTLLHIAGTLDVPTSGSVLVAGYNVSKLDDAELSAVRSRNIGFVFQQFHLLNGYSALDNVADGLLYTGMPAEDRRSLAVETLEGVELGHRLDHLASKLSGGERQRVAVARAIIGDPQLVLADEPTGNLDSKSSEAIIELLEELHRRGITMAVITHNPDIAERFPRRIEMFDGRVANDHTINGR